MNTLESLGFEKNTKPVNGFRPHYKRGDDFLFLVGADFFGSKICRINKAFENRGGKLYAVLTEKAPRIAHLDLITTDNFTLLKLNPLSKGQWNAEGSDMEWVETEI